MPSSAHVAVTTTKGSALPIGRQSRIKEDTVPRSGTALFAICILLWISFIGARRIARGRLQFLLSSAAVLLAALWTLPGPPPSLSRVPQGR
jgi:hypothetical protein